MRRAEHITSRLGFVLVATLVAVLFACMPAASFAEHGVTSPPSARTSSAEIDSVTPLPSDWLDRVNRIREIGDIPAVAEDPSMSDGCFKHARYMAENDWIGHDEDPANPWYTPEGRTAAQQSNCYLGIGGVAAIDGWVRSPFHGIGVLDPELHTIGFGTYTTAGGRSAAALNVLGGRGATSVSFPLLWPGDGQEMPYLSYPGYESPNPLAGTAWTLPVGAPVYAQFGAGSANPVVTASRLSAGGADLEHMVLTEFTYTNPDSTQQSLGRLILGSRDAVVILPRQPLVAEKRYDVNLTVNGQDYAWSFYTSDRTPPMTTASMRGDGTRRVDITLSASDAGSGVAVTEYSVDGTGTQTYAGTLSFDQTGDHTIEYWSEDVAGNVERSSSLAFAVGTADPPPLVTVPERLAGNSRYTTAVRIARESFDPAGDGSWPEVRDVIIASGEDRAAADPLAASGLCWAYDAPLFLVGSTRVDASVIGALREIAAANGTVAVHIVGGPVSVPDPRYADIRSALGGASTKDRLLSTGGRYDLAAAVARRMRVLRGAEMPSVALVANGADASKFFDALALSPISARMGAPILLVKASEVPAATSRVLAELGPSTVVVGGGPNTVSPEVCGALGAHRWSGRTRFSTAADIAEGAVANGWLRDNVVGLAAKLPDALTGGSVVGREGGVLLLTSGTELPTETRSWLSAHVGGIESCYVFGGTRSVAEGLLVSIAACLD